MVDDGNGQNKERTSSLTEAEEGRNFAFRGRVDWNRVISAGMASTERARDTSRRSSRTARGGGKNSDSKGPWHMVLAFMFMYVVPFICIGLPCLMIKNVKSEKIWAVMLILDLLLYLFLMFLMAYLMTRNGS